MNPVAHAKSAVSLLFIISNLMFWMPALLLMSLLRLAWPAGRPFLSRGMARVYRLAVLVDDWWLQKVLRVQWNQPCSGLDRQGRYLVLANHRSWTDILLVQSVLTHRGPIVNFLVKRELIFVPIIGLIMWAFEFPMLRRRSLPTENEYTRRLSDRQAVLEACTVVQESPAALLIFPEGTRFTELKRQRADTEFQHLLPPRPGGFTTAFGALSEDLSGVIDLTLILPKSISFWTFLSGRIRDLRIDARFFEPAELPESEDELTAWIVERWQDKDRRLHKAASG